MKVLLDECIPRKFKNALPDHECQIVPEADLAGQKNALLISLPIAARLDSLWVLDTSADSADNSFIFR